MKKYLSGKDLPKIQEFLTSIGLKLCPYDLDNPTNIAGNPLVRDGLNGIRATYDNMGGRDRMSVWFTNEYWDLDNPTRLQVEKFLETLDKNEQDMLIQEEENQITGEIENYMILGFDDKISTKLLKLYVNSRKTMYKSHTCWEEHNRRWTYKVKIIDLTNTREMMKLI